jgi:hypothetical protein
MGVFAGTERQCTEDEHDDEDENDSQTSEFGLSRGLLNQVIVAAECTRTITPEASNHSFN